MPDLPAEEDNLDILQNIELTIHYVHMGTPDLTDYEVDRALETLLKNYQGEAIGKTPAEPHNLNSLKVFTAVRAICNLRLGRNESFPDGFEMTESGDFAPITLADLTSALKRLRKSLEHWNKQGGSQGYLNYISQFVE